MACNHEPNTYIIAQATLGTVVTDLGVTQIIHAYKLPYIRQCDTGWLHICAKLHVILT